MSWSINVIGTPKALIEELERHKSNFSGQSLEEYEAAVPHIIGLIKLNFSDFGVVYNPIMLDLEASGSTVVDGVTKVKKYGNCAVILKPHYKKIVT